MGHAELKAIAEDEDKLLADLLVETVNLILQRYARADCVRPAMNVRTGAERVKNLDQTCSTCVWNQDERCACEVSRFRGYPVKAWNRCGDYNVPTPHIKELIHRLENCINILESGAIVAHTADLRGYYDDRAKQCWKCLVDLNEGALDADHLAGKIWEFEEAARMRAGNTPLDVAATFHSPKRKNDNR